MTADRRLSLPQIVRTSVSHRRSSHVTALTTSRDDRRPLSVSTHLPPPPTTRQDDDDDDAGCHADAELLLSEMQDCHSQLAQLVTVVSQLEVC